MDNRTIRLLVTQLLVRSSFLLSLPKPLQYFRGELAGLESGQKMEADSPLYDELAVFRLRVSRIISVESSFGLASGGHASFTQPRA